LGDVREISSLGNSRSCVQDNLDALCGINGDIKQIETYLNNKKEETGKFKNDKNNIKDSLEGIKSKIAERIKFLNKIQDIELKDFEKYSLYEQMKEISKVIIGAKLVLIIK